MTRKRLQSILFATVLCIIAVCIFASCDKNEQHFHEYGEWTVVREATCETDGLKERTCNGCDQTEQEKIAALGHSYGEWVAEVAATCNAEGVKGHYECSVCHKNFDADKHELADLTITKADHTYGEWVAEVVATCMAEGVKGHYECSVCHKNFDADKHELADLTISKADHTYGEWVAEVVATCMAEGVKGHYECSVCHKNFDADKHELADLTIAKADHTYGEWIDEIPTTCMSEGVKGHYHCSVCNEDFDADNNELESLTIAKNHVLNFVEGKSATCVDEGVKDAYRCTVCRKYFDEDGNELSDLIISANGHRYGPNIAEVAASATENGVKAHKDCLDCGLHFDLDGNELESLTIPATEHVYTWVEEVPATCDVDGKKAHYECSHCSLVFDEGYNVVEDLTIAHGHDLKSYERVESNCRYDGHVAYDYCKKCGKNFDTDGNELDDVVIPKLEHVFGQWIEEVAATCTRNGVKAHKTCSLCNEHFDEEGYMYHSIEIPAHHDCTLVPEVSATCTTSGMQAHGQCAACGKMLDSFGNEVTDTESLVMPAKGHLYGNWVEGITATCNDTGMKGHYHCSRCDKNFDREDAEIAEVLIQPIAHVYTTDEIIPRVEATCTQDGALAHFECELCNKYFDEDGIEIENVVIEKKRHTFDQDSWVVGKSATCTEDGTMGYYVCPTCHEPFSTIDYTKSLTAEDLIVKARGHKFEHVEKIEATCEDTGTQEHYYCERCYNYFDTDKNKVESFDDLEIAATGHDYGEIVKGTEATANERGTVDHYECSACHKLFDDEKCEIDTIYVPATESEHDLTWIPEESPSCDKEGKKGYFECSHCDDLFDKDYQKIEASDLVIPAGHEFGDLVPVSQGKCDDPDILVAHYFCTACGKYFTEDMIEIDLEDIYFNAYRHNFVYSYTSTGWGHVATCLDCGYVGTFAHELTYSYYVEDGENYKVGHCDECGFDDEPETYETVERIVMKYDFYVGYHNTYAPLVWVKFITYTSDRQLPTVMSAAEFDRFEKDVEALQGITQPVTKTYTVSYNNYTDTLSVTFRPYEFYGIVTEQKYYQQGRISSLDNVAFVIDSNFTRETGEIVYANGRRDNDGGFDANYDFETAGTSEVTFTVTCVIDEKTYDVKVTLVRSVMPLRISDDDVFTWIMRGQNARIGVYYTDGSLEEFDLTDDMIIDGSFDPSKTGKQTFTVSVEGLIEQISIIVRDPYEVAYFDLVSDCIDIGEDLYIRITYVCGDSRGVKVTPDMIIGKFDNTVAGYYEITISYEGKFYFASVDVIDPTDVRIRRISTMVNKCVWGVDDNGNVVPNLEYLYLVVYRMNDTMSYVKVNENMISYDETTAKDAYMSGGIFTLTISYFGQNITIDVAPRNVSEKTVTSFRILDTTNLSYGNCQYIFMKDGDLSRYFVELRTDEGVHFVALDKSMFYDRDSQNAFDFVAAKNNQAYDAVVKCDNEERDVRLLVYTESDIEYYFTASDRFDNITVGTREEVLAQLVGKKLSFSMHVCNNSSWIGDFYFEDMIVAPNADVDFSKPGIVAIEVSYKGIVSRVAITLIPNVEGVEKAEYTLEGDEFVMYENGYFSLQYSGWGTYTLVNEELGIYKLAFFDAAYESYVQIKDESAIEFRAEMLEDNLEEYLLYTIEGLCTARIYTKNGFSMADIYDAEGYYQLTTLATFSLDGKSVRLMGVKYTFGDDNTLDITQEGNVVYRAMDEQNGSMIIRQTLNDNGKFYLIVVELDDDGNEIAQNIFAVFDWVEKDGVITVYEGGIIQTTGKIVNGYFVPDIL